MPKRRKTLSGTATFKEIAAYFRISKDTLARRLEPLRPFLYTPPSGRKDFYSEDEVDFIKKNIRI